MSIIYFNLLIVCSISSRKDDTLTARKDKILELLKQYSFLSVNQLSKSLHFSQSTIRRDLFDLEKVGLIQRTRGGAMHMSSRFLESPSKFKQTIHTKEKKYISELATNYIEDYHAIFLDGSSTCNTFAKELSLFKHLNIITPNLKTALELEEETDNNIFALGGNVSDVLVDGLQTNHYVQDYLIDMAFISCRGLQIPFGLSDRLQNEADLKRTVRDQSKKVIALVDHFKFNKGYLYRILSAKQIDVLITDEKPSSEYIDFLKRNAVELVY